jgi:hypothetical protein
MWILDTNILYWKYVTIVDRLEIATSQQLTVFPKYDFAVLTAPLVTKDNANESTGGGGLDC